MIADKISNWRLYGFGGSFAKAFEFVEKLSQAAADKDYPLRGNEIIAKISSYETKPDAVAVLEAHRKFVDLQLVLSGKELLAWLPLEGLPVKSPYDPGRDVEFLSHPDKPFARIPLYPGSFALFFPQDAHAGMITLGKQPELVKKVVVKIGVDLIEED